MVILPRTAALASGIRWGLGIKRKDRWNMRRALFAVVLVLACVAALLQLRTRMRGPWFDRNGPKQVIWTSEIQNLSRPATTTAATSFTVTGGSSARVIQAAIDEAPANSTVSFAPGRYSLSDALNPKSGQTYQGNGATLVAAATDFAFRTTAAVSRVTIQGFAFEGGGIDLAYGGEHITITENTFTQIAGATYRNNGIFVPAGLSDSVIARNRFIANPQADNAILGMGRWQRVNVVENVIDDINEGIHIIFGPTRSKDLALHSSDVDVSRNTIARARRIGIELQSLVHRLTVSRNRIGDWLLPASGHMALSIATTENDLTNNSTDIRITDNVLIGNGQTPDGNDCAIEAAGNDILISGNFAAHWGAAQLIAQTASWQTTNNTWAGIKGKIINPNNGYTAPTANTGNTVIAAWDGKIPP